jgi:hypothetical protein
MIKMLRETSSRYQVIRDFALAIQGLFELDSDRILKNTKHYLLSKVRK